MARKPAAGQLCACASRITMTQQSKGSDRVPARLSLEYPSKTTSTEYTKPNEFQRRWFVIRGRAYSSFAREAAETEFRSVGASIPFERVPPDFEKLRAELTKDLAAEDARREAKRVQSRRWRVAPDARRDAEALLGGPAS